MTFFGGFLCIDDWSLFLRYYSMANFSVILCNSEVLSQWLFVVVMFYNSGILNCDFCQSLCVADSFKLFKLNTSFTEDESTTTDSIIPPWIMPVMYTELTVLMLELFLISIIIFFGKKNCHRHSDTGTYCDEPNENSYFTN